MPDLQSLTTQTMEDPRYVEARRRVQKLKRFYQHSMVYCVVNFALLVIDYFTGPSTWFYWSMLGWGVALGLHAFRVYGEWHLFGSEWERNKISDILQKQSEEKLDRR